jgi:3'-phosphoadenosine 5'-phosphosulfate sulfotransferase (PAPS reductase)/FAD synthetase
MKTVNVGSISGGKDSTAMWLFAIEKGVEVLPVFADTGHEHPMVYQYLDYLEKELGPIRKVKADFTDKIAKKREYVDTKWREEGVPEHIIKQALDVLQPTGKPFLDLCLWKGRFPSTKARFCTQFLKREVIFDQVYVPIIERGGGGIVSWQGVRADESLARRDLPEREETPEGIHIYRPLIAWNAEEVFAMHSKHGIEPNPLYKQGMSRVGCMPCINANKGELYEIARRYPEEIERVKEWEVLVAQASKRGASSFFSTRDGHGHIEEAVEWSKTAYGGQQYDLVKAIEFDDVPQCSSSYGLCE